jgi:hypothetical protein
LNFEVDRNLEAEIDLLVLVLYVVGLAPKQEPEQEQ